MYAKSSGQFITKALVYGWYHKGNLGDDLFIESFRTLLPGVELTFVDHIEVADLQSVSAVIFGGGSFLLGYPDMADGVADILDQKKIYYLGVGVEKDIHPFHERLMRRAEFIAIRSSDQLERVKAINPNTMCIPDLVYALRSQATILPRQQKKVLIVPNVLVIPKWDDPQWKHASWNYFKSEFCQFLDYLVEDKYQLRFLSMCQNDVQSDTRAAMEIISGMRYGVDRYLVNRPINNFQLSTELFSQCTVAITQRFHGIVLSEVTNTPYMAIQHHDKLRNSQNSIPYYGLNKDRLIDHFNQAQAMKYSSVLPIETNIFERLRQSVLISLLEVAVPWCDLPE